MNKKVGFYFSGFLWICLVPYFFTILLNGSKAALLKQKIDVELILPVITASQIKGDYCLEAIKAQAVICRSDFYRKREKVEKINFLKDTCGKIDSIYYLFHIPIHRYEKAIKETKDKVATIEHELKLLPYHEISGGKTRDGWETLKNSTYSYLKEVESKDDKSSIEYLGIIYIKKDQLPENLKISKRDRAGYVTELTADGKKIDGESFSYVNGLASANFTMKKLEDEVRFLSRGKGHGLGFSQYGGNEMAKRGCSYEDILKKYFPKLEIIDIKNIIL